MTAGVHPKLRSASNCVFALKWFNPAYCTWIKGTQLKSKLGTRLNVIAMPFIFTLELHFSCLLNKTVLCKNPTKLAYICWRMLWRVWYLPYTRPCTPDTCLTSPTCSPLNLQEFYTFFEPVNCSSLLFKSIGHVPIHIYK